MKKKLLSIMLLLCLCLIPAQAWAAADGGEVSTGGVDFASGFPTEETIYTAGSGSITFTPATNKANAKLTLNNATINKSSGAAIVLPSGVSNTAEDIVLIGENSISNATGINQDGGNNHPLTISGTATDSLTILSAGSSALYHQSDLTFKGGSYFINTSRTNTVDITGNLNIENNAQVNIYNISNFHGLNVTGKLTVDNSNLYVQKTTNDEKPAINIGGAIELKNSAEMKLESKKEISINKPITINGGSNLILVAGTSMQATQPITIDSTSQFTLCAGSTLKLSGNGSIVHSGSFYNNGVIDISGLDLSTTTPTEYIKNMKLCGTGIVKCGDQNYSNNGTTLHYADTVSDLTEYDSVDHPDSLETNGILWHKDTQTLELKNTQIANHLYIPNDITLLIHGSVMIDNITLESSGSTISDKMLTIKGADDDAHLYSNGVITMNNSGLTITDLTAELTYLTISNTTQPFNIVNSDVTFFAGLSYMANYDPTGGDETTVDYGLNLTKSNVTVKDGYYPTSSSTTYNSTLWVERITLDKKSSFTLDRAEIHNYGYMPKSMNALKNYIPKGYSIGHCSTTNDDGTTYTDESVTVLDKKGNYASYFTMKYRSTGSNSSSTSYTITATAGDGGTISPKGSVSASKGTNRTFTITAKDDYKIADVLVDGKSVGAVDEYTFKDISTSHTIKATFKATDSFALNKDDHTAYVTGYEDGTVRPNANITRAETATMLYRLLTDERLADIKTAKHSFSDIPNGAWYTEAVATMSNGGYITGYEDNIFRGNNNITRAEFVTMLVRFIKVEDADCSFTDVPKTHWAYSYIATAAANEWLTGYEDGTFRPEQAISRAEAMAIINRVLERGVNADGLLANHKNFTDNSTSDWYYYEVIEATNSHDYNGKRPSESWTALNN